MEMTGVIVGNKESGREGNRRGLMGKMERRERIGNLRDFFGKIWGESVILNWEREREKERGGKDE